MSCQIIAEMEHFYDDLIIINLYVIDVHKYQMRLEKFCLTSNKYQKNTYIICKKINNEKIGKNDFKVKSRDSL